MEELQKENGGQSEWKTSVQLQIRPVCTYILASKDADNISTFEFTT